MRIETPGGLKEYLDEFDILFPLTDIEAETVLEYIKNSGYVLETDGQGQLYKMDMESGESWETDIDHIVDDACEQNYEKMSDVRDYFKQCDRSERESLCKFLHSLSRDEAILKAVFSRTYFQKEINARLTIIPSVRIAAGRRV